ncbi:transglutaminase domain-containing protein [uncultured Maribacter sp.]|uniref:transglutaminase domain-containing protein n=1 Tax=uncultured Maribacter sp. TaxID=431308 RepID=UPI0030D7DDCA|tara:strand:+ start:1254 stop:2273 length:1020 start_codon:yes stop_codon:yes gene_type:complete
MRSVFVFSLLSFYISYAQRSDFNDINFKKADSVAEIHKGESLRNLPVLTHNLTAPLDTDVEKFRAIYTWISSNIENDYSSYLKISNKRKRLVNDRQAFLEWNSSITPKVFERLLTERKTACTGYAYLVKEMANLAGFNCEIIDGYGRTPTLLLKEDSAPNHSWNTIEINNKWYLCDATWSAGQTILEDGNARFEPDYFDGYFLAEPKLFVKNHYSINSEEIKLKGTQNFTAFIEGPVIYKEAFLAPIIPVSPQKMYIYIKKGDVVTFKLNAPDNFKEEKFQLLINNGGRQKPIQPNTIRNQNKISLIYRFEKIGLHDVHILVDDDLISTYVVKVKKVRQ